MIEEGSVGEEGSGSGHIVEGDASSQQQKEGAGTDPHDEMRPPSLRVLFEYYPSEKQGQ